MRQTAIATTTVLALLGVSGPALAQTETAAPATLTGEVAEQCLDQLSIFTERMAEDGYWFAGYRAGWGGTGYATPPPARVDMPRPPVAEEPAAAAELGPWGARGWPISPSFELRTLQSAAAVLAYRGDAEGCNFVNGRLQQIYDEYVMQLEEAGVEPGELALWRQEQIAAAVPVGKAEDVLSVAEITGTEVRSPQDGHLGTVEDVVMAPENDAIDFVIVGRGGFFGFAEDYVAVPWEALWVTPGLETFILDATEEKVANAPSVDPERERTRAMHAQWADEIEAYWQ
jgi:sporulation protein YlmC with PRC-barrel domain